MPNRWSVTHYLFTYRDGFIKRALWGELLWLGLGDRTADYLWLAGIAVGVLALLLWLFVRLCRGSIHQPASIPVLLVVSTSPAITMLAHLVGYLEQIGYVAVLATAALARGPRVQCAAMVAAAALLPLVHEAHIFWLGALSILVLLVKPAAGRVERRLRLRGSVLVVSVWIASTGAVLAFGHVPQARADAIRRQVTTFTDTATHPHAWPTLTRTMEESVHDMRLIWADPKVRVEMAFSIAVFGPGALFLLIMAWRLLRSLDGDAAVRWAAAALVLAAVVGPLLLHVISWDRHRWNALATFNVAIACVWLIRASGFQLAAPLNRRWIVAAVMIAAWNVSADPVLFDGYRPNHAPFVDQVQFLWKTIRTRDLSAVPTQPR